MPPLRLQQQRRLQKRLRPLPSRLPLRLRLRILKPDPMHLHKIAQVLKSNGTDGELVLGFRDIAPEDISIEEPVFICFDGLPVPFFIESFQKKGQAKAVVKLTDIESSEDAREVTGQAVYADCESLGIEDEDDFSMLEGWTLLDEGGTAVGQITGYMDIPGNPCLEVRTGQEAGDGAGEIIIPLHEDLVLSIDEEKRELTMSIPAGLL